MAAAAGNSTAAAEPVRASSRYAVRYRTASVDGIKVFYREAGDPSKRTILLLHGFSSSSHMFRDLLPLLARHFHVVAPDYPGFGYSDAPPESLFVPSFATLEGVMTNFVRQIGLKPFLLYMQDFGGPVGFRMAVKNPGWIEGLIIQNANAYVEGLPAEVLSGARNPASAQDRKQSTSAQVVNPQYIKHLYVSGSRDPSALNPDAWMVDIAILQNSEARRIQAALIDDYFRNIPLYPQWQAYLRQRQPKTLVVWGKNDRGFSQSGAEAFRRDLRDIELRFFDTGHFALEEDAPEIAEAIIDKFSRSK